VHVCDGRQSFELSPLKQTPSSAATSAPGATSDDESDDDPNIALLHKHDKNSMSHNFANPNFDDNAEPAVKWNGTPLSIAVHKQLD
jgi:hypothetical protein